LKRWNWIEDLLLPPAVAVLASAWMSLCVRWSVRAVPPEFSAPAIPAWVLGLLLLAAMLLTRWALTLDQAETVGRLVLVVGGVVAVFAVTWTTYGLRSPAEFWQRLVNWGDFISPVFLGVVACTFMWWQGIVLGRSLVPQEQLERSFYRGIAALVFIYAVNQARPLITASEGLAAALAFFATGLSALALLSVENARRWQSEVMGHWPSLNRYWLSTVAGVIAAILAGGLLAGGLLSPTFFEQIAGLLTALANALTIAFVAILGSMVFLAAWVVTPFIRFFQGRVANPFQFPQLPTFEEAGKQTITFFDQHPVLNLARQGLSLIFLAVVVGVVFWWAFQRFTRTRGNNADEERDSIATRNLLLSQLRALLRRASPAPAAGPAYLALTGPRDDPRLMVRRAYQTLLEWAPNTSLPRRAAAQTPAAYAAALAEALPQARDAIDALTLAYVQARYAPDTPSLAEARAAQGALNRLQSLAVAARSGRS
jgi:hypothetical protein